MNQKQYKVINTQASNKAVCLISFALDQKTIEYERTVYSFMDMFGFLGGLYDFLYFCGYFCIAFFQTRLFDYTVFSGLYHLEVESKEDNHEEKTAGQLESMIRAMPGMIKSQDNINNEWIEFSKEEDNKHNYEDKKNLNERNKSDPYSLIQTDHERVSLEHTNTHTQKIEKAKEALKNRRRFDYKWHHMLPHLRFLLCWKRFKSFRRDIKTHEKLYSNCLHRLNQELDLISVLKSLRRLEILISSTMNEHQKHLSDFSKCHTIPKLQTCLGTNFWLKI